ncbi:hypothetical protein L2E82_00883 [Cichorium intybus]|uniref:Uncharacterized protein n=1 Tax=Cichorium intybus TaxID=13427 RepID=A0ACB9GYJ0_CICIN|nr:hypothetical protein L2E82_00883 [Cichorium intybus]
MGKLEDGSVINHFSHEHPLKLQQLQAQITSKTICPACDQSVCGSVYSCISCNFYLHKTCSNLPRTLKHKSDQQHELVLLSSPAYPEGVFKCNACGFQGNGFSYHCPECQLDLHVVCASKPLSVDHVAHSHKLSLCFKSPYENQAFSCDICKEPGSNQWLYRCDSCEFDMHMKCPKARTTSRSVLPKSTSLPHQTTHRFSTPPPSPTPAPPPIQIYYSSPAQYPQVLMKSTSLPSYETHNFSPRPQHPTQPPPSQQYYYQEPPQQQPYQHPQVNHYQATPSMGVPQYAQSPKQTGFVNNMAGHAVEGLVGSVASEIIQAVFEGMGS